jgi:hypothetical protein
LKVIEVRALSGIWGPEKEDIAGSFKNCEVRSFII